MSNGKVKSAKVKTPLAATPPPSSKPAPLPVLHPPPLFRRVDWLALLITFAVVWTAYFLTLAPELTLEDSGELCTGAYYAGIPHPPGYPFWTIYSWLWTALLPISNIAWRVEVGESTAAAMGCALVAFMVSRGSSMLMEGIEELKSLTGKWENAICLVVGVVAGLLLGFDGVMWSESVAINRISLFGVPWLMVVLLCLLRWIYAPHQRRYLYIAMFFFGLCLTIHQTLLVAAIGLEVAIAIAQPKLGRDFFLGNSVIFVIGLIASVPLLKTWTVWVIYIIVGLGSIAACIWLALKTKKLGTELVTVLLCGILYALGAAFYFYEPIAGMTNPPMEWGYPRTVDGFYHAFSRGQYEQPNPTDFVHDPGRAITQMGMLVGGVAEEYNWLLVFVAILPLLLVFKMKRRERAWLIGLAATYGCIGVLLMILMNPSPDRASADLIKVFFTASHAVVAILIGYGLALIAAFMATHYAGFRRWGLLCGALTLFPAAASFYMADIGVFFGTRGIWSPLKVFACILLMFVSAAAALYVFTRQRQLDGKAPPLMFGVLAACFAFAFLCCGCYLTFIGEGASVSAKQLFALIHQAFANKDQYGLPVYGGLLMLAATLAFLLGQLLCRQRAPLALTLAVFACMPVYSALCHWGKSEQRNHWFGYWFGHDMFTPPFVGPDAKLTYDAKLREQALKGPNGKLVFPEMTKDAVLFGGTDPGRFCPTYMIFCESFTPHNCQPLQDQHFDRRDVYIITQNALADGTYLEYIRAQFNKSQQIQYDTPFFSGLMRWAFKDTEFQTNLLARLVTPLDTFFTDLGARVERRRRTFTSWFTGKDFVDLPDFTAKLRAQADPLSKYLFDNLSAETRQLLSSQGSEAQLRSALATDLNRLLDRELRDKQLIAEKTAEKSVLDQAMATGSASERQRRRAQELEKEITDLAKIGPFYQPERFKQVTISEYLMDFIQQNPQSDTRIRLNRLLLEAAFPKDIAKSLGGVYPDREIYIPTPEDHTHCFNEYMADAARRKQLNQLKPGEYVDVVTEASGQQRVQVSGQTAVMSINGLLTKVIFDHNPKNEFYVEESFPLDWMYPYLEPYGIIMKIDRNPLPSLSEDILKRDHEFWARFSDRLIGNWITYDTSVKEIAAFVEKVYLRHDYSGFKGDRKFVRDDQAQKSFSKLRSSIASSIYAWRLFSSPAEYRPKTDAEFQTLLREADFASKQAFAFCAYSPEAVFRYVQLLSQVGRYDDALIVAETCYKLDPYSPQAKGLVDNIRNIKKQQEAAQNFQNLENEVRNNPTNFQAALTMANAFAQAQQTDRAVEILSNVLQQPQANLNTVRDVAQTLAAMGNLPGLEIALEKLVKLAPNEPEACYDLAALKATLGKGAEAIRAARTALELSDKRLAQNPKARDLRVEMRNDGRFNALRSSPEFQKLIAPR